MATQKTSTRVGYLSPDTPKGPDTTTFGYAAAQQYFEGADEVEYRNFRSHEAICIAFARKEIDYGVVAVENVIGGIVPETIRAIKDHRGHSNLCVCGEVVLPIELYYLRKEASEDPLTTVLSHSMALTQCDTLVQQLKTQGIESKLTNSTGEAAYIAQGDGTCAAIASVLAEKKYGLKRVLPYNVVDNKKSMTRFWILGKEHADKTGRDKTAFLITLKQESAGALWKSLGCFVAGEAEDGLYNLKEDDKRPNLLIVYPVPIDGKRWEYEFLLEFGGHISDFPIDEGQKAFKNSGLSWGPAIFLGSYPDKTHASMVP